MTARGIEDQVGMAVHRAKLAESMLHAHGWEMNWGPLVVPAVRHVEDGRVSLVAEFPAACHVQRPEPVVYLILGGQERAARAIADPGDDGFTVRWDLSVQQVAA